MHRRCLALALLLMAAALLSLGAAAVPKTGEEADDGVVRVYLYPKGEITQSAYVRCTVKVVDPTGEYPTVYDSEAHVKIRGKSTAAGAKKPYNIQFSSQVDLLGMGACKKWYLLANMYDKSMLRNKLAYDFAADAGMAYTPQSTFCQVYLKGTYIGTYQLCESVGVGASRVDIDTAKNEFLLEYEPMPGYSNEVCIQTERYGMLLGLNAPIDPTEQQYAWLERFLAEAEDALASGQQGRIPAYFDIDSFVDDYIVHELFKCVDVLTSSTRYYIQDGKLHAGPLWDFDLSAGNADKTYYEGYFDEEGNSYTGWWCRGHWFAPLLETEWFQDEVKARFAQLQPLIVNLYQDNELGTNRIDSLLEAYGAAIAANYAQGGWDITSKDILYEGDPVGDYDACISQLRDWLEQRNQWMLRQWSLEENAENP